MQLEKDLGNQKNPSSVTIALAGPEGDDPKKRLN